MDLLIYTDGAARGNPGPSSSGFFILDSKEKLLAKKIFYNGITTNNVAEYKAVIAALEYASSMYGKESRITLRSDSNLIVNQINGKFKVKSDALRSLHTKAKYAESKLASCKFINVPRENKYITLVDSELNKLLDKKERDGTTGTNENESNESFQAKLG